ncbi:MAG: 3-isopropylmalate dehydrogenase [Thermoleophilia bacterium]|jgi:3-isopropylmalate dehydrogenase|nr:3-isopropylmalate dehydrogenase [Thermoleophilia bacterium]
MGDVRVVSLPGDGIGPEVVAEARRLVDAVAPLDGVTVSWEEHLVGGCAIDATGGPLPDGVMEACAGADAVLLGAVGGPRWDTTDPDAPRPEQALLALRAGLGLFANLRPVRPFPALYDASPLRRERIEGTDLLVVRELTGGIYFGARGRREPEAFDTCVYSREEIRRVAERAFAAAAGRRAKVTSVDKANVLESSRLWREVVVEVAAGHPGIALDHMLVDNAAMQLVSRPADFDVIVTENMFGDILSDEAAMISGSIGLLPSASLGDAGPGLYEPVHGSAPDIAGRGVANPIATCLSAAMMLRHSLGAPAAAGRIESAVAQVLEAGHRTRDLGGALGTREVGDLLLAAATA